MHLDQLELGRHARITGINGRGGIRRKLFDLGLTPGTLVYIRKRAPLGDPILVSLRGFELSLRKSEAARVEVAPDEH